MIQKQDSTWEDIVSRQSPGGMEEEAWDGEEGCLPTVEPQFKEEEEFGEDEEEVIVESVVEKKREPPVAGELPTDEPGEDTVDPRSQDSGADSCWGG